MDITQNELEEAIKYTIDIAKEYENNSNEVFRLEGSGRNSQVQQILFYYFVTIAPQWSSPRKYDFKREFTLEELMLIFKGVVIIEGGLNGHLSGSVSAADKIYGVIAEKDYGSTKTLRVWLEDIGAGEYFRSWLVNDLTEARLAAKFSKNPKEKEAGLKVWQDHCLKKMEKYE